MADSEGKVLMHRLIMARKIGRTLKRTEKVHHVDGNPLNNKTANLELCTDQKERGAKHAGTHVNRKRIDRRFSDSTDPVQVKVFAQYFAIVKALRAKRRANEISQEKIGNLLHVTSTKVSLMEEGVSEVSLLDLLLLAEFLEIDLCSLIKRVLKG
jgi:predicted XRE-type DNA-binding protein